MKQPFFFVRRMRSFECRELVTEPKCRISLLLCLIVLCLIIFIRCKQVKCRFNVSASYYTYGVDDVKAPWQFSRTSFISTFAILYDIITRLTILLLFSLSHLILSVLFQGDTGFQNNDDFHPY